MSFPSHAVIVQRLNTEISESPHRTETILIAASGQPEELRRKLAGFGELTLSDLTGLCHVLGIRVSDLLAPVEETKPIRRGTEPGQPGVEELQGVGL